MLYVGAGINIGYYQTLIKYGYLTGLEELAEPGVIPFLILLDFEDEKAQEIEWLYPGVKLARLSSKEVKCPSPINCLQHGAFLPALERTFSLNDKDAIVFTDGDIRIQRKLLPNEIAFFEHDVVVASMNWHDQETLQEELSALRMTVSQEELAKTFQNYSNMKCYNTGVLGMSVSRWRELYRLYCELYPAIDLKLGHYAKQQWLLSWIMQQHNFPMLNPLSDDVRNFHCHGHHPRAIQDNLIVRNEQGKACRGKQPILFAHKLG